jgi:hypothetical protein
MTKPSKKLRELLSKKELLIAPAAYDALSVKIIEAAGKYRAADHVRQEMVERGQANNTDHVKIH